MDIKNVNVAFRESFARTVRVLDFIETPVVQRLVEVVHRTLDAGAVRDIVYPLITGMMGVEKTECGQEVCRRVRIETTTLR